LEKNQRKEVAYHVELIWAEERDNYRRDVYSLEAENEGNIW
jgi:hypothetical protein